MIGEAEVWRESTSETSSKTDSTSKSLSLQNRSVVDAQVMRQLGQNQAVAVLQINNISYDDVVELVPLFL